MFRFVSRTLVRLRSLPNVKGRGFYYWTLIKIEMCIDCTNSSKLSMNDWCIYIYKTSFGEKCILWLTDLHLAVVMMTIVEVWLLSMRM